MDWLAGLFELFGLYVLGNKKDFGFILNVCGNIIWIIVAFKMKIYGLLLVVIPAIFINIRNYKKWSKCIYYPERRK